MGIYVELIKSDVIEPGFVYYNYQFSVLAETYKNKAGKLRNKFKLVEGTIKIDKRTGETHVIDLAEGDKGLYAQRADSALRKHWEKGEFPDKTCWAS